MQIAQQGPRPGAGRLFLIWAGIGLQSFGGGASTILLIQREFVDKRHWLTMEEFAHYWNLCLFAPGINLVALTILIGKKMGGTPGILSSLAGMLIPSATITCLIAAGFQLVEHNHITQAVLKGVIPSTGGIMLLVGINFARPQLVLAYKESKLNFVLASATIILGTLAIILLNLPVFIVIIVLSLLGIVLFTRPLFGYKKASEIDD
ncbi:MAG: hypothetical protein NVS2B12_39900 [Ktedonobacteraceae bacterium]